MGIRVSKGSTSVVSFSTPQEIIINKDDDSITSWQGGTWNVTNIAQPGVDIGDVTVNNAAGAAAVNIQDGGNSITVDGAVTAIPTLGTLMDRSGTATTTTSQLAAANSSRKYFFMQNSSGGAIWINFTTSAAAASPSIELKPNDTFVMENSFISMEAINVISTSGSRIYTAKEG